MSMPANRRYVNCWKQRGPASGNGSLRSPDEVDDQDDEQDDHEDPDDSVAGDGERQHSRLLSLGALVIPRNRAYQSSQPAGRAGRLPTLVVAVSRLAAIVPP